MEENLLDKLGYENSVFPDWIYATLVITKAKIHYTRVEWLYGAPRGLQTTSINIATEWGPEAMIEVFHVIMREINQNDFYLQELVIGANFSKLEYMAPLLFVTQSIKPEIDVVLIDKEMPKLMLELGDTINLDEYYSNKFPAIFSKSRGLTRKVIIESCLAQEWAVS